MAKRIQLADGNDDLYPITACTTSRSIEDNTDLNTLTQPGFYHCANAARAQTLANCPTTSNFVMYVAAKGSYVNQIIFTGQQMYLRAGGSSSMGTWYQFDGTRVVQPYIPKSQMAQSIKLNDDLYLDASGIHTDVVEAEWTAQSSSASLTTLTQAVSLTPGTWLCIGHTPVGDTDQVSFTLRSLSGTTNLGNNKYFRGGISYTPIVKIFKVTATANVVLRTANTQTINFTYLERGGLTFVKLASQLFRSPYDGMAQSMKFNNDMYLDISGIKDGALTTGTFTPNSETVSNGANMRLRRRLNTGFMQISINLKALAASTTSYVVGSIPATFAPPFAVNSVIQHITSTRTLLFQIDADGTIKVSNCGTASVAGWYDGFVMWPIAKVVSTDV